ncbi:hypothetical protein HZU73_09558 [Apis mellifera caucasica]|nr:hypothetical protein HZU73_09558 [Apis mellifera caucasica]
MKKHGLRRSLCLLIYVSTGIASIVESIEKESANGGENRASFEEGFGSCLAGRRYATLECVNRGALIALRSIDRRDDLDFGGVHLERADGQQRREEEEEVLDWDYDPKDFGNVVRAATELMERRSLRWNLDSVYPGLELRAGPTLNGNGVLEFVVNEESTIFGDRQQSLGPGRQMMRHLLIPFLLGFKFNLASLIPLMFGFLLLLTKKALLLTKVALVITGLLGWNSFFSATYPPSGIHHSYEGHGSAFPPHYEHYHNFHHRPPYRGFQGNDLHEPTYYGQHVIREVVDVYDNAADQSNVDKSKGRKNFVWVKRRSTDVRETRFARNSVHDPVNVLPCSSTRGQQESSFAYAQSRNEYARLFDKCAAERNAFDCLKRRALEILDSAIKDDTVYVLNEYVSIGRDPSAAARNIDRSFKENGTELSLDQMLDNKFHEYISSRNVKLTIPGDAFQGRKKKDKGYGALIMGAMAVGAMMAQLAYGKIAFIAGTALLTAKIALVLSAIIGLKKLVSSHGGGGHEVIYATGSEHHGSYGGGGYGGGWQRAMEGVPTT